MSIFYGKPPFVLCIHYRGYLIVNQVPIIYQKKTGDYKRRVARRITAARIPHTSPKIAVQVSTIAEPEAILR